MAQILCTVTKNPLFSLAKLRPIRSYALFGRKVNRTFRSTPRHSAPIPSERGQLSAYARPSERLRGNDRPDVEGLLSGGTAGVLRRTGQQTQPALRRGGQAGPLRGGLRCRQVRRLGFTAVNLAARVSS